MQTIIERRADEEPAGGGVTIWVDVEDLFDYVRANPRPSGIQRVAFEIYAAMAARLGGGGRLQFLRHQPDGNSFRTVHWDTIKALFEALSAGEGEPDRGRPASLGGAAVSPVPTQRFRLARALLRHSPAGVRAQYQRARTLYAAARDARAALAAQLRRRQRVLEIAEPAKPAVQTAAPEAMMQPGDILLALGAPWFHPDYGALLAQAKSRYGVRIGLLLYDLIPLRYPEWCHQSLNLRFGNWLLSTLPQCDWLFAISRASAEDVALFARQRGIALPGPVRPVPLGTGYTAGAPSAAPAPPNVLLPADPYALFVSTIEPRKNHMLLVHVWRKLLNEMSFAEVPMLVFAGRIGWMVSDLMQQLANADYFQGKIKIVQDPTDAELSALYQGALFTVFPSLVEGWGLPVTESLALGKPCVIANVTSLPEAGGTLARYFDPDSIPDAYRVIRTTIEDRDGLDAWTTEVAHAFRPVPWSATVDALLAGIGVGAEAAPAAVG